MFSRRHLRTRVMQALYGWYNSEEKNAEIMEKEMLNGIDRSYDLYLSLIQLIVELAHAEEKYYADAPAKLISKTPNISKYLYQNSVVTGIAGNKEITEIMNSHSVSWQDKQDVISKLFKQIRNSDLYREYVSGDGSSEENEINFVVSLYKDVILNFEVLQTVLEEQNIWWAESLEMIMSMVLKTIRISHPDKKGKLVIMPLFREETEDKEFLHRLFTETIRNDDYYESLISGKTSNWEVDRIALLDIILLKMALTEILHFGNIPVKVSINEYIEISKDYSTPKSKVFINGVLDSIVKDLRSSGEIVKTGRGLID